MRIAQLSPLAERVPPETYGGTELVVSLLTEGLVKKGHEITLFASGDSKTKAKLVSVIEHPLRTNKNIPVRRWPAYDYCSLLELEKRLDEFDVIHNHMGYQALPFLESFRRPTLTTNHNNVSAYCAPIYLRYSNNPFVSISESYKQLNYPDKLNYIATVYNGIDINQYPFKENTKRTYLFFIGRICADKGTAEAIEMAMALGLPLKIAGKVDEADKDYFEQRIKPLLTKSKIEYLGEVNLQEKIALYAEAIAVLYPINFDEPFGLVMAESMAMGTPLLALNRGSVKEVVEDGVTGITGNTIADLIKGFEKLETITAQSCRERAVNLFSSERMVNEYEKLYKSLC